MPPEGTPHCVDKDKKTERTILYTSPKAYNRFRTRLWEIYPKTEP